MKIIRINKPKESKICYKAIKLSQKLRLEGLDVKIVDIGGPLPILAVKYLSPQYDVLIEVVPI